MPTEIKNGEMNDTVYPTVWNKRKIKKGWSRGVSFKIKAKRTIGWVSSKWDRKPFNSRTACGVWEREKQVPEIRNSYQKKNT